MALSEPDTKAVELFEKAIEKELHGLMSDAVQFYRAAFKLNDKVDLLYREEKLPQAIQQLKLHHGKNAAHRVDDAVVRSIDVASLLALWEHVEPEAVESLEMDISITSPLVKLPGEVWTRVMEILMSQDPESWFHLGMTCKRFAFLAFGSSAPWRTLARLVYPRQVYNDEITVPKDPELLLSQYGNSWRRMCRERPFAKFHGCYISVVNYYSEGARDDKSISWTNPVKTNTYYRYLRVYPDGTCIMALTTLDPPRVLPHLLRENPTNCLVDAADLTHFVPEKYPHRIYRGTWSTTLHGHMHVIISEGSVPYYVFHYNFHIRPLGGVPNHGKLVWDRYYAIRKKMHPNDLREGEVVPFSLRNECAFKFSRVRSYNDSE